MTQHTQGRLHVAGQDKVQIRSEKHQIAKAWSFAGKTGQENARRLVACWNACEGISTVNLEDNLPVKELATRYNAVLAQRDELLEALKDMATAMDAMGDMADGLIHPLPWRELRCEDLLAQARAAIAKATGQTK